MQESKRVGLNIGVVGGMGSGKTHFIKDQLLRAKKIPLYAYDPNEEYTQHKGQGLQPNRAADCVTFKQFLDKASKAKFAINVFEEVTPHLNRGSVNEQVLILMTRKRHLRLVNYFVWHTIRDVPLSYFDKLDYLLLFHTNDRLDDSLLKRFEYKPEIVRGLKTQRKKPKYSYTKINMKL